MAQISDEMLAYIVKKAENIDYGEIRIMISASSKEKVDVEVVDRQRFRIDDQPAPFAKPNPKVPRGSDPPEDRRRG